MESKVLSEIKTDVSFIYQLSWGLSEDWLEGGLAQGINNRNQVIGLASPSGALVVGRFDTPFKTVGKHADLFWHSQLGQNRNITNANNWDIRADKIIAFQSPKKKGFQTSIAYVSDISDTSKFTENASAISLNGFYQKGSYKFGAAYEQHNLEDSTEQREALRLSATYRKGPLKVVGFFQKEDNATVTTAVADADVFGVGLAYKIAKGTLKAQYYARNVDSSKLNPKLLAIGYDYKWSKRSEVYFQVARNSQGARLTGHESSTGAINSNTDRGIALGVRYKF